LGSYDRHVEDVYARFGRELRRVRRQKKMTQDDLATKVNLGRTSIVNIESGRQRVHLHTFLEIADALQVNAAELLPESPPPMLEFEEQLESLPAPERDWVMRLVAQPATPTRRRRTDGPKT